METRGRKEGGKRHKHRMYCSINAKAAKLTPSLCEQFTVVKESPKSGTFFTSFLRRKNLSGSHPNQMHPMVMRRNCEPSQTCVFQEDIHCPKNVPPLFRPSRSPHKLQNRQQSKRPSLGLWEPGKRTQNAGRAAAPWNLQ